MKKLLESFDPKQQKHLNLVLLLTPVEEHLNPAEYKFLERKFYVNRESVTGYSYYKPISKIIKEDVEEQR